MREAHLRYLLAAALVVVAGYGVYTAAPQDDQSPSPTASSLTGTPIETTPIETTAEPPEELAPGLTWAGVVDPRTLSQAHANALANTSFSSSSVGTQWTTNGSHLGRSVGYVRASAGGRPLYFAFGSAGDDRGPSQIDADIEIWREENVSYSRWQSANETSYRRYGQTQDPLTGTVRNWDTIYTLFASVNTTTVERIDRNGTIRYRVVSTSQPSTSLSDQERSNYSLSALIGPGGVVYRYHVSYDYETDGQGVHVSQTTRISAVGSTTVAEPTWVDDARNATSDQGR